jgi:hypothetical protein
MGMQSSHSIARALAAAASVAIALVLASCGEGSIETMERSSDDPVVVAPTVSSFLAEREISLSWPEDDCADEYLLESASGGAATPSYAVLYKGKDTSFRMSGCEDQSLHLFRLVKLRGEKSFGPSNPVLGVGSSTCRDASEPNDSEASATDLGYQKSANLYYYRSFGGLEIQDVDWYSLKVPPRMVAYVVVEQTWPTLGGRASTWMYFAMKGQVPTPIANGQPIAIANYSYVEATMAFEILPFASDFVGTGGPQGGSLIDYTVRLEQINGL